VGSWGSATLVRRIPGLSFNFMDSRCRRFAMPHLNASLREYRNLLGQLTVGRSKVPAQDRCPQLSAVAPHEYRYIAHVIRRAAFPKSVVNYLEIGVGLGAASLFMARFGLPTNVIGVDAFRLPRQREEADRLRAMTAINGTIHFVEDDRYRNTTLAKVQTILGNNCTVKAVHILMISGAGKTASDVEADFVTYSSLVIDGGYIIFDEFSGMGGGRSTSLSGAPTSDDYNGARRAVLGLMQRSSALSGFTVVGNIGNELDAGPYGADAASVALRDWPRSMGKSIILRKGTKRYLPF
jgi:hypothetical protein